MAEFVNYKGENIEPIILATRISPGIITKEEKVKINTVDTTMELITEQDIIDIWAGEDK